MKTIVIGDIHGCYGELIGLLNEAGIGAGDRIISLGDFLDRGPDSPAVLDFFRSTPNAFALQGNHERKHVRSFEGKVRPALSQRITRRQIGEKEYPRACEFLRGLPLYLDLPEAILIHGFLEPGIPLSEQHETVLSGTLSGEQRVLRHGKAWYEAYQGTRPVIVGHQDYSGRHEPFIFRDLVYGLDTDCCRGGALSGVILPEFRIVSVKSAANYWNGVDEDNADLRYQQVAERHLTWEQAEKLVSALRTRESLSESEAAKLDVVAADLEECRGMMDKLLARVSEEHQRVLHALHADSGFGQLSPRERAKRHAETVNDHPLRPLLLFRRRKEADLTGEDLRTRFARLADFRDFCRRLGLVG